MLRDWCCPEISVGWEMLSPIEFRSYDAGDFLVEVDVEIHNIYHILLVGDINGSITYIHFRGHSKTKF
jgi:hypothetical protein